MKKLISMLMAMLMLFALVVPVSAEYKPQFEYEAQMLYDFGLFKGTDKGFELDKKCDRLQAAALFVRLLGKEAEALSNPKEHPFTDVPDWASPYVGQMYHDGYTKGISATEYGVGDMTANQFATFCLRALGYSENGTKWWCFKYEEAIEKMLEHSIIRQESYDIIKADTIFLRDYAVKMAYNSLFMQVKGKEERFLIKVLVDDGVIDEEKVKDRDIFIEEDIRYLYSVESFVPYFESMIREATSENKVVSIVSKHERNLRDKFGNNLQSLLVQELLYKTAAGGLVQHRLVMADDLTTFWKSGHEFFTRTTINPTNPEYAMAYRCKRYITHGDVELTDKEKQVVAKSKEFLATITDDMSDYDKFKAAYDYIARNVQFNDEAMSGDIDVLVDGISVCHGFAAAYRYLCALMELECWFVSGKAGGSFHAWNKVKLDGKYYNVDPTWNEEGYKYFLFRDLPDREILVTWLPKELDFTCHEDYKH